MPAARKNPLKKLRTTNIIYPIILGLGVIVFMFAREFNPKILSEITFRPSAYFWILVAVLLMAMRDFGYLIRIKILSDNKLSWGQALRIIMLWEFTSAVTPSAIGGTSVALIFVNKEGISLGKSSAIVMATSFLDELYFLLAFPLLMLFLNSQKLFHMEHTTGNALTFSNEFFMFAVIGYSLKFVYVLTLSYGLFFNPRGLKWLLLWIFKLPLLRRWKREANEVGSEIVASSIELRKKPLLFWLKSFGATAVSWTSRYWVVNALFMAFFIVPNQILLFARQLVAWIMMLVSPTPGGSGFSEYVFVKYFSGLVQADSVLKHTYVLILALLWRLISYYPYLIVGSIIFPRWIKSKFGSGKKAEV